MIAKAGAHHADIEGEPGFKLLAKEWDHRGYYGNYDKKHHKAIHHKGSFNKNKVFVMPSHHLVMPNKGKSINLRPLTFTVWRFIFSLILVICISEPQDLLARDKNMTQHLYLATQNGLLISRQEGETWVKIRRGLNGYNVTSVIAYDGYILAGTTDGIFRSVDDGQTWSETNNGLSIRYVRWLAIHPEASEFVLAGTEPAGIFVSRDRADSWLESPEIYQFREKHGWFLPYSPEAGCVRGFAIANTSKDQSRVYAAVEVGGVLVSYDKGVTWQLVEGSDGNPDMERSLGTLIHPDVHSISTHPSSSDLVTAPTGGGLYRSVDGGKTWISLYRAYCRAVWVNPDNPQHIIFGPADGVSRNGRIEESNDGGRTWHSASTGITVPWAQHMVERFFQVDKVLLAVLSNGELLSTSLDKIRWHHILPEVKQIRSVASNN